LYSESVTVFGFINHNPVINSCIYFLLRKASVHLLVWHQEQIMIEGQKKRYLWHQHFQSH